MDKYKIFFLYLITILWNSVNIFSQELPKVMYVNSKEGLIQRKTPSLSGERIGVFLHGERIIVYEKENNITIDGISDFWYRVRVFNGWGWIFGGYLSEELPIDVEPILGMWNTDQGDRLYWDFRPDHKMNSGRKESDSMIYGDWYLSGNILTINLIPIEFMAYTEGTMVIYIEIIDRDNIILLHEDGKRERLIRNNNII